MCDKPDVTKRSVINSMTKCFYKRIRVFGTPEDPLFLARDVAEWIDYSKKQDGSYRVGVMLGSVDNDEKINIIVPPQYCWG